MAEDADDVVGGAPFAFAFAFTFTFEFDGFFFFLLLLSSSSLASAVATLIQTKAVASTVLLGEDPRRIVGVAVGLIGSNGSGSGGVAGSVRRTDTQSHGWLGRRKRWVDNEIVVDFRDVGEIEWWEVVLIWRVGVTLSLG